MQISNFRQLSPFFLILGLIGFVGCGGGNFAETVVQEANKTNVQKVANCYAMYQFSNNFKGPKDKESFVAFLGDAKFLQSLESMGIDPADIEAIFTSERDNEEIKIRWGVPGSSRGSKEPVAFEATGVDGTRLVAFTDSRAKEVTDASEYDLMLSGKYVAEKAGEATVPDNAAEVGQKSEGKVEE